MKTIRKFLVSNKHMQLQLILVQFFLSAAIADSNDSHAVEMAENSTQSALRNQIAGKSTETAFSFKCTAEIAFVKNFHSNLFEFISSN